MKILITGGAGFIASHVADKYIELGHDVVIVDNLRTGHLSNVNTQAKFYNIDICSHELEAVFEEEKPDIVNHHAAQVSVPLSVSDPLIDAEINIKGLINVLQNCVLCKTQKIIFISSGGAIYGEANELPTSEGCIPKPLSVYAINKLSGENYLNFYHHQYGLNYSVLRYANVYGPRQISHGEAGVVSIFIEKLLSGETPNFYAFPDQPDGMIRDYVYIKDVVNANIAILSVGDLEAFNIATMIPISTGQLYREITAQLSVEVIPHCLPARAGDLRNSLLNPSKAKQILNWEPQYSLSQGIAETIQYFKNKLKL